MKHMMKFGSFTCRLAILLGAIFMAGCANMYVDDTTKEINSSQFKKPDPLHPAQVLFEFQTKGVANARATDFLKEKVIDQIKSSGMFSEISEGPVTGGALLSITLNNVPVTDDAFNKGFVTGLTFGLAGSQVTDGYLCTVRYVHDASSPAIVKQARHAIHTTVGNTAAPANATKAANATEAVTTMTHQIVSHALNDLSHDAQFK